MTTTEVYASMKEKMEKAEQALRRELGGIRAGRANASILNRVMVEYYGVATPLNQVASITVPEARMLLISPYDKTALPDIEKGINASDVGITPTNDGSAIRLVIPQLTEDRRKELAKEVKKIAEQSKIVIRNARRDAIEGLKKLEKEKEITEDDIHTEEKTVQKMTDDAIKILDKIAAEKEAEILEV